MTPVLRHSPGDIAPVGGCYTLVGHYGEMTNFSVRAGAGERLPEITVAADIGPFWYVLTDEANEQARVA